MVESGLLERLLHETVVLDLTSPYVVVGQLEAWDHRYLMLVEADVHDLRDTKTTRERYVCDARRHGITANRARVYIRESEVVAVARLADVLIE